jgi:hypothetical protein
MTQQCTLQYGGLRRILRFQCRIRVVSSLLAECLRSVWLYTDISAQLMIQCH